MSGQRHTFEVLDSRTEYTGRVLALRIDKVSMPGDAVAVREVVEHPGAVAILALDEDQQVTMVHQYRHPLRRRLWELPAGLLDVHGEDPVCTAQRELVEEVGLAATDWSVLVDVAASPGFTDESVRVYLAGGLSSVQRPVPGADEEADLVVRRFPLVDAVAMVMSGEVVNAASIGGILAAQAVCGGSVQPRPVDAPWIDLPTRWAGRQA